MKKFQNQSKINKFPHCKSINGINSYLACFKMLADYYELPLKKEFILRIINDQVSRNKNKLLQPSQIASICELIGLRSKNASINLDKISNNLSLPALGLLNNNLVIFWEYRSKKFFVGDPVNGQGYREISDLRKKGVKFFPLLSIEKDLSVNKRKFGWSWFIPSIKKNLRSLSLVVLASFFVQLLGVFNPLLIQQIIDAVIMQGNISSLNILGAFLILMAFLQALMYVLRTYIFSEVTNNIDFDLGSTVIRHLFRLPLGYFSKRKVGELSTRINELEKIRNFLTGTALTAVLDTIFSFIYIFIMCLYSVKLTLCALLVIPFFMGLTLIVSPIAKKNILEQAIARAKVNSHLVEGISGIESVKSQGLELVTESKWDNFYKKQIDESFKYSIFTSVAGSINNLLQQFSGLIIIWFGALLVFNGELSIGGLIAFRILSSFVTSPILRITSLWQNFQETIISLERLSDILDQHQENDYKNQNLPSLPLIKGNVKYKDVSFRFSQDENFVIKEVSLEVESGSFVGIIGLSGSGKSTLMKILNRLVGPHSGKVTIDENDISKINLYSLRSQIGFFPQESFLFDGTIQENISIGRPDANFEEISYAAWLACADKFIEELPNGFNTYVGERGATLSGGQKQRIALARSLLNNPNLIILDEATSSLDVSTEEELIKRLRKSFPQKTIFFITHRLSNVVEADLIITMEKGKLIEKGTHQELIKNKGLYFNLLDKQRDMY